MTSDVQCQSSLPSEALSEDNDNKASSVVSSVNVPSGPPSQRKESPLKGLILPSGTPFESNGTPSRASSNKTLTLTPFGFEAKTSFNASDDLTQTRSKSFTIRPAPVDDDIWKRPPPDFRPQVYAPKPPKRNSREAVQPWKYTALCDQEPVFKREKKVFLASYTTIRPKREKGPKFRNQISHYGPF